uniref:Endonuclease/exonuclease/phosphatase domain-containing protein n=1 Tax=Cannabis sativa TaxID=3483 RepID=A0A803PIW0_CANSA
MLMPKVDQPSWDTSLAFDRLLWRTESQSPIENLESPQVSLCRKQLPWCVIGELNNIANQAEKRGRHAYPSSLIEGFQSALHDCQLHDLELRGYPYTWERGRNTGSLVEIRLDKALVTRQWLAIFHEVTLTNLDFFCSDHTPIILELNNGSHGCSVHHFCFENLWCREPMCKQIVKACWEENGHLSLVEKIKVCSLALENWGKSLTCNFKKRLAKSKSAMAAIKHDANSFSYQEYAAEKNNYFEILAQ